MLGNATVLEVRGSSNIFKLLAADPNNVGDPAYVDVATGIITGGSDQLFGDNRGNRHQVKADISRYADNLLVMNAEYRYEIFAGLDMAVFADAGKVFMTKSKLNFSDLEGSWGVGMRFNARNAVFLRLDAGFSHEGFQVWVKFNNVF